MVMKYFTEKDSKRAVNRFLYHCDHALYSACTLYELGDKGLAVVQKRFNPRIKVFWYGPVEPWLAELIFANNGFNAYFAKNSGVEKNGIFPTVTVRQIMWALKMKPLRKEWWEAQEKQLL